MVIQISSPICPVPSSISQCILGAKIQETVRKWVRAIRLQVPEGILQSTATSRSQSALHALTDNATWQGVAPYNSYAFTLFSAAFPIPPGAWPFQHLPALVGGGVASRGPPCSFPIPRNRSNPREPFRSLAPLRCCLPAENPLSASSLARRSGEQGLLSHLVNCFRWVFLSR